MRLTEIMSTKLVVLTLAHTIREACQIFLDNQIDGAPVVNEKGELLGLLTKSHIYRVLAQDENPQVMVGDIMKHDLTVGHPDEEIKDIFNKVGRLPVVDKKVVVGMITRTDLAKAFIDSFTSISDELLTILDSTHNLIIAIDSTGKISLLNRVAEKFLGLKSSAAIGRDIMEIIPNTGLMEVLETGVSKPVQKIELRNCTFISNRTPIKKNGEIIGAVAVLQDISELENTFIDSFTSISDELLTILDSTHNLIIAIDRTGKISLLNRVAEKFLGLKNSTVIGRDIMEIIPNTGLMEVLETGVSKPVQKIELRNCTFISNRTPIKKNGEIIGAVAVLQDISELENISRELENVKELNDDLDLVLNGRRLETISQKTITGKHPLPIRTPVFYRKGKIFRVLSNVTEITELKLLKQQLEQAQGLSKYYEAELRSLKMKYAGPEKIIVSSQKMKDLMDTVVRSAQCDSTVLITGESGTGKELIAETIHNNSFRKNGPYIKINCGAICHNILKTVLFGYEDGAFAAAKKSGNAGYFELASGGTLFLDKISELPYNIQVDLLRVVQSKEVIRVGGKRSIPIDVRILAASKRDIPKLVEKNEFDKDLYHLLNVVTVKVPPLRERKEEIPVLAAQFVKLFNKKYKKNKKLSSNMIDVLMEYDWPGNIRELENMMERLVVTIPGNILSREHLPLAFHP